MSENRKIPYRFVPIPRFFLESEYLKDAHFLQFICFAFSRTLVESGTVVFYQKPIFLEPFEFIYGRLRWSQLLQQEEYAVRKYISRLQDQKMVSKVTSKSTSKYTVFTWERECFLDFSCQQNDGKLTSKAPARSPQTKNKNIKIETTTGDNAPDVAVFSGVENLNSSVKKMLTALSTVEQEQVIDLFKANAAKQKVTNPSGWVRKCIEEGWYYKQKVLEQPFSVPAHIEENRKLATLVCQKLSEKTNIHMILKRDFVEFQEGQLFYHEDRSFFRKCLEVMMKKWGYDLQTLS